MTIGDFSRASRLSAKTLRFYHRSGLLEPAQVDDRNGYRLYSPERIADAQVVRTLRDFDVPIDAIRDVLMTPNVALRTELIAGHLHDMERKLDQTRATVQSLRAMLDETIPSIAITYRSVPESRVLAITATIDVAELSGWFRASVMTLQGLADNARPGTTGPIGGIWSNALFADERGEATLFLPLHDGFDECADLGVAGVLKLPAVVLAVATHAGPDATVPSVYAALGEHVARHELSIDAPVRETYLQGFPGIDEHAVTEIGWPIFRVSR